MKIQIHADPVLALEIQDAIQAAEGHCPCVLEAFRSADTKCMCKAFREAPEGSICNCGLYIKIKS